VWGRWQSGTAASQGRGGLGPHMASRCEWGAMVPAGEGIVVGESSGDTSAGGHFDNKYNTAMRTLVRVFMKCGFTFKASYFFKMTSLAVSLVML